MLRKLTVIAVAAALTGGAFASTGRPASAQSAPSSSVTAGFTTFLSDVLAGRVPPNISSTLKTQSSQLISGVRTTFASLGTFRRLEFVREDTLQGYHRYHYRAVFDKGSRSVAFVTDANGTILGFLANQPSASPG